MLDLGDRAPDFKLPDESGRETRLADFKGKKLVLYFYPKDDTPGCTAESCAFRDNLSRVRRKGAEVVGISADSPKSHTKFREKYDLPFTLLSDEGKEVIKAYGVWKKKSFLGRAYMGIERTTFVIGERGIVTHIFRKVKVAGHVDEVLKIL
jgi:peroxiredoxin Q/BCP